MFYLAAITLEGVSASAELLTRKNTPLLAATLRVAFKADLRQDSTLLSFSLENLVVHDQCSKPPYVPYLLTGLTVEEPVTCSLQTILESNHIALNLRSQPLKLYFNEPCITSFFDFLSTPVASLTLYLYPITSSFSSLLSAKCKNVKSMLSFDFNLSSEIEIGIEVNAPILFFPCRLLNIPYSSQHPNTPHKHQLHYVVFDMGKLSSSMTTTSTSSILNCRTTLSRVRAAVNTQSPLEVSSSFFSFSTIYARYFQNIHINSFTLKTHLIVTYYYFSWAT